MGSGSQLREDWTVSPSMTDRQTGKPSTCQIQPFSSDVSHSPSLQSLFAPDNSAIPVTDAHCHPTDNPFGDEDVANVGLGGICAMATRTSDQSLVAELSRRHGVEYEIAPGGVSRKRRCEAREGQDGMEVIACFGE
jgi:hypothetical protein